MRELKVMQKLRWKGKIGKDRFVKNIEDKYVSGGS